MAKVAKNFIDIKNFIATIDVEVNMERMQIPKMHAVMYFKQPDKIHFDSQSFFIIPREGIALNPLVLQERYSVSFDGTDTLEGKNTYKLLLTAKETKTRLQRLYVWVSLIQWTIMKIETIPYEGRTLTLTFTYVLQQEKFWLPIKLVVSFKAVAQKEKSYDDLLDMKTQMIDETQRMSLRNGSVTILYSDYKVNIGIEDSIFEKRESQ
jgi:outer membrane lipoprotein-sorting protein